MTGYKVVKRTRMCFEQTDRAISIGRSPLCGGSLIICCMFFLTLMHPLEVITSFWYPNIIWGKNYYTAIFPLFAKRGEMAIQPFSRGENLLYSHFPTYPGKGEIWLYSHFSGRKMAMGGNGSIPPALSATTFRLGPNNCVSVEPVLSM